MMIEKSGFLLMAGALAAGGVGGWLAHDSKVHHDRVAYSEPPTTAVPLALPAPSAAVIADRVPAPPACDDSMGTVDDCPAMGPADEGVCSNFAAKRCAEFKSAFKPKVAQTAVACLKNLKGNALCDPARVNQCGHAALMAACPEPTPDATKTELAGTPVPSSPVITACDNIAKTCAGQALAPTPADCRQTLSGMSDFGRASMIECLATHCGDKGLLGCEAVKKP
jgi:hypothetical protein